MERSDSICFAPTLETCCGVYGAWRCWCGGIWGDFPANNMQNFSHHSWYSTGLGNEMIIDWFDGAKHQYTQNDTNRLPLAVLPFIFSARLPNIVSSRILLTVIWWMPKRFYTWQMDKTSIIFKSLSLSPWHSPQRSTPAVKWRAKIRSMDIG